MIEFSLESHLAEMVDSIKGKPDRFLRLQVQVGNRKARAFEFSGAQEDLVEKITDLVKKGEFKVISQAIGTYTDETNHRDSHK
jgi:hypothetical protein